MKDRIQERNENKETERKGRLEVISINRKKLRSQVSRIKESLAEMSDSNTFPLEKLWILLREQWILISASLTSIVGFTSTTVVALTGGVGVRGATPPKDKLVVWLKDKLQRLSNILKCLAGKAVSVLPEIIGSALGAVLNFLAKAAGFAASHVWAFIVGLVGLITTWI